MSEIYLTKIERKTIFTKSLIFVLIMFIISDLTVTGPFYFNFIPWMYILGVLGSIKQIDSILMCIIGSFTVLVASLIMQTGFASILNTIVTLLTLVLGIITGKIIYQFVLERRLVKYIKHSKKIMYIVTMIIMFIASYVMVGLNSGNVITYLKSKTNLQEYITKTYNIEEYDIVKVRYSKKIPGKYAYTVKIDDQEVDFVPIASTIFKDTNKEARYVSSRQKIQTEMKETVASILGKYSLIQNSKVTYDLEYGATAIIPDVTIMMIEYVGNGEDDEKLDDVYEQLASCIKELQTVKKAQKVAIIVNEKTLHLSYENIQEITADYIKGGLEIELIS